MKPLTVANIALSYGAAIANLISYVYRGHTIALILTIAFTLLLAYWIWTARRENQHRRDMQNLINEMSTHLTKHGALCMEYKPNLVKPETTLEEALIPKIYKQGLPRPIPARGSHPYADTSERMRGISDHLALIRKGL